MKQMLKRIFIKAKESISSSATAVLHSIISIYNYAKANPVKFALSLLINSLAIFVAVTPFVSYSYNIGSFFIDLLGAAKFSLNSTSLIYVAVVLFASWAKSSIRPIFDMLIIQPLALLFHTSYILPLFLVTAFITGPISYVIDKTRERLVVKKLLQESEIVTSSPIQNYELDYHTLYIHKKYNFNLISDGDNIKMDSSKIIFTLNKDKNIICKFRNKSIKVVMQDMLNKRGLPLELYNKIKNALEAGNTDFQFTDREEQEKILNFTSLNSLTPERSTDDFDYVAKIRLPNTATLIFSVNGKSQLVERAINTVNKGEKLATTIKTLILDKYIFVHKYFEQSFISDCKDYVYGQLQLFVACSFLIKIFEKAYPSLAFSIYYALDTELLISQPIYNAYNILNSSVRDISHDELDPKLNAEVIKPFERTMSTIASIPSSIVHKAKTLATEIAIALSPSIG